VPAVQRSGEDAAREFNCTEACHRDSISIMTGIRVTSHAEMLYMSTIRVLTERVGATRPESGAAFVVSDEGNERFLVTARHVVSGVARLTLHLYTGDSVHTIGAPLRYEVGGDEQFWVYHADSDVDVAVARFEPIADLFERNNEDFFAGALPFSSFQPKFQPGRESFTDKFWRPLPLDEVLLVGYPNDYRDVSTSLPLLRRGRIATPLWLDHEGRPVFLVDSTAAHGTSGGPVAYVEEEHHVGRTMHEGTGKITLLGVFSEVLPLRAPGVRAADGVPQRPPNVGAAYKAYTILEAIAALKRRTSA